MKYHSFLTRKYLVSRLIAFFAVFAVAAGVGVLLITLSVMEGFKVEMRDRIRGTLSHLRVEGYRYLSLVGEEQILAALRADPDVVAASPYVNALAIFKAVTMDFCNVQGIDPVGEAQVGEFASYLLRDEEWRALLLKDTNFLPEGRKPLNDSEIEEIFSLERRRRIAQRAAMFKENGEKKLSGFEQSLPPQPIVVGLQAVKRGLMRPGQVVQLSAHSALSEQPRSQNFLVVGVFMTGAFEDDLRTVYMPIKACQEFLDLWDEEAGDYRLGGVAVRLRNYNDAAKVRDRLEEETLPGALGNAPIEVQTWEDARAILLRAVDTEKTVISIIMIFLIIFAAVIVFVILYLMVIEKTRDLGVLASLGATPAGIIRVFTSIGMVLCLTGAAIGTTAGLLITHNANEILDVIYRLTGWQLFPPDIYYLTKLPVKYTVRDFTLVLGSTVICGILGSLLPAIYASLRDPIKALHHE